MFFVLDIVNIFQIRKFELFVISVILLQRLELLFC